MTIIVGLAGCKGHGKDTVAKALEARGFVLLRFADPLKNMLRAFYATVASTGFNMEPRIEGAQKQIPCPYLGGRSPREAMQTLGTEWGRQCISDNLWVDALLRRAKRFPRVVVPDVRFANECLAIQLAGGSVFRVYAGGRVPADEFSDHASEREIKYLPVDGAIDNSGSLHDLEVAVQQQLLSRIDFSQDIYA